MFRSLSNRLILSHIVPFVVVMPLICVVLLYMQSRFLFEDLSNELTEQARLLAVLAAEEPSVWQHADVADAFVDDVAQTLAVDVTILTADGDVLAATREIGSMPNVTPLLAGEVQELHPERGKLDSDLADIVVPVKGSSGELMGAIWLTHHYELVEQQFYRLYAIMGGVLGSGMLLGAVIGWLLALNLQRPLADLTDALEQVADNRTAIHVPERGALEFQRVAQAFNELTERLHTLEEARQRLLANLVHELGRPLGALLSAIEALRAGGVEDAALRDDLLRGMHDEIGQLRRLLDDLSQLSERVLGALEMDRRPLALDEWLPGVLAPWGESARAAGLAWCVELPEELPAVLADADRLAQVLGNLLSNAIKYTTMGGAVFVTAGAAEEEVWIAVTDTGPGVASSEQGRIFEPFQRAWTGRRFPQGMGLGLTIAREIAVAHGGRLELEESSPRGSKFMLWLPGNELTETVTARMLAVQG